VVQPVRIEKDDVSVVIYTEHRRVEGRIHPLRGSRLSDFLNSDRLGTLIPVTDARVFIRSEDAPLSTADVLDVHKGHVAMVIPRAAACQ
jgi:hypothetical protein